MKIGILYPYLAAIEIWKFGQRLRRCILEAYWKNSLKFIMIPQD